MRKSALFTLTLFGLRGISAARQGHFSSFTGNEWGCISSLLPWVPINNTLLHNRGEKEQGGVWHFSGSILKTFFLYHDTKLWTLNPLFPNWVWSLIKRCSVWTKCLGLCLSQRPPEFCVNSQSGLINLLWNKHILKCKYMFCPQKVRESKARHGSCLALKQQSGKWRPWVRGVYGMHMWFSANLSKWRMQFVCHFACSNNAILAFGVLLHAM